MHTYTHIQPAHWVFPVNGAPIALGFVAWHQQTIVAVGPIGQLPEPEQHRLLAQLPKDSIQMLTPGLINTHTHLELTLSHLSTPIPILHGETMGHWLRKVIHERTTSPLSPLEQCITGAQTMLAAGTTCVNDISAHGESLHALAECGLRGVVSMEWFWPLWDTPTPEAHLRRYFQHFVSKASSRLRIGLSPHAPYNVSPASWKEIQASTQPALIHTHVAESDDEDRWLAGLATPMDTMHQQFFGKPIGPQPLRNNATNLTPFSYLFQHGCFTDVATLVVMAHGITLTQDDWETLHSLPHVSISHCPRSNQWLHQRTLSPWVPREKLSLGTDSSLSCPTLSVKDDALWCHQHHGWSAEELLTMLTLQGAQHLGLAETCGTLTPGNACDMVHWQLPIASQNETPNALLSRWLSQSTAQQVWVDGKALYQAL